MIDSRWHDNFEGTVSSTSGSVITLIWKYARGSQVDMPGPS